MVRKSLGWSIFLGLLAAFGLHRVARSGKARPTLRITSPTTGPRSGTAFHAALAGEDDPTAAGALNGDRSLRDQIDLEHAVVEDGRYVVRLARGRRAILTLDPVLQAAAERVLVRAKAPTGAIVVMATDGRILALAGRSAAQPQNANAYQLAVTTWAPAASIFKLVTTAALLASGLEPATSTCFHGGFRSIDLSNLRDVPRLDSRCEDLTFAVAGSQNAIIAKLAHLHLSSETLGRTARALGMDAAPDFAIKTEPNHFTIPAEPLEFARMAAGFWSSELSPIGGAVLANAVASGGLRVTPRIVAEVIGPDGTRREVKAANSQRALNRKVARQIAEMMVATTEKGTAAKGFHDEHGRRFLAVSVAGKTGSLDRDRPSFLSYSWFVGFAPANTPAVSISVVLGNAENWHLKAHTAARLVLAEKFQPAMMAASERQAKAN